MLVALSKLSRAEVSKLEDTNIGRSRDRYRRYKFLCSSTIWITRFFFAPLCYSVLILKFHDSRNTNIGKSKDRKIATLASRRVTNFCLSTTRITRFSIGKITPLHYSLLAVSSKSQRREVPTLPKYKYWKIEGCNSLKLQISKFQHPTKIEILKHVRGCRSSRISKNTQCRRIQRL